MIPRPDPSEHAPFYARYVEGVPDGDLLHTLRAQMDEVRALAGGLSEAQALHRYAEGKWSVKEVLAHVADAERVMAYRALRIARGDATPMPGFDENAWVAAAGTDRRSLAEIVDEMGHVRQASIALLAPLGDDELARTGTANGATVSVRALAWIIAGHERHHLRLLRERYL